MNDQQINQGLDVDLKFQAAVHIMNAIIAHPEYKFNPKDIKKYELQAQSVGAPTMYQEGYKYKLAAHEAFEYVKALEAKLLSPV